MIVGVKVLQMPAMGQGKLVRRGSCGKLRESWRARCAPKARPLDSPHLPRRWHALCRARLLSVHVSNQNRQQKRMNEACHAVDGQDQARISQEVVRARQNRAAAAQSESDDSRSSRAVSLVQSVMPNSKSQ